MRDVQDVAGAQQGMKLIKHGLDLLLRPTL